MAQSDASAYGLDTSVVLRLLVGEPKELAAGARRFVEDSAERGVELIVSDLVVAESYFALHFHYKVPKREAMQTLLQFLESNLIHLQKNGTSVSALQTTLAASSKMGLVDRMIHEQYRQTSASMVSFERAAGRLGKVKVLRG